MAGNQNNPVRRYEKQYAGMLKTVFGVRKAFAKAMAEIQILDGVQENAKAFSVKTNATPVVIGTYATGTNDGGFGDATGKKSRFGDMTEVKYDNADVEYDYTLAIHEGLDRYTVNNDLDAAVADRLKLQSEAQTRKMNLKNGQFLADNAGKTEALADFNESTIKALFNKLDAYYTDLEVTADITVYLRSELHTAIIDMQSNTSAKGSSVSLDTNGLLKYKDFFLEKTPAKYFPTGVLALFSPDEIAIPFVGISTARTVEATEFDGVKLQAAAKGGTYMLDDNKKAVVKVTGTVV
ncbi:phage capsid protein [Streptococcus dysgalactiae]|uniref:Major capsid protein n=1 Tax=Streptococcus dysgalactiae subsp. equisimilis TaxID=119602 RepID=A0AAE9R175_STREQ|nr:phage capsid protein [Streptococcus dysgalactiae]OBY96741.1 phage capsid protein [Streptococcus dysgalactiae subsp. equisimilis]SQB82565.1 major capsid protein [Streptococcus dysgalactiae]VTT17745.1 major capsid protein [Streptococcus dysgalactiae]VTT27452.1 major capsid protein [Streptococcus dysgalactiae subsp. equisimilis]